MKIESVRAYAFSIPSKRPSSEVPWVWGDLAQVYVEVRTADGLVGYGEAFAYGVPKATASVVNDTLRPLLEGEDATRIKALTHKMFQRTHIFGRHGITTFAIGGVEMALWDLAGKRAGMPLYDLLGGAGSKQVPAYASLVRYPEEHSLIAEQSAQAVKEGYTMIKLHQITAPSVEMSRKVIGDDIPITVDINCEWSPFDAIRMAVEMNEYDLLWLEEPVWPPEDFKGLATVQATGGVPLAAGENACTLHPFREMMEAEAVSFVQPSVIKVGGIAEFLKVAQLADLMGFELAPHSPYFGPGFLATLHLIAHTGQARWVEKIYFDLEVDLFKGDLKFANGSYTLPEGPGLGLDLNLDALKQYAL